MRTFEAVSLKRDVEAVEIPAGTRLLLEEGTEVTITQSLGGTFTVNTDEGIMARIDGKDADALGRGASGPAAQDAGPAMTPQETEQKIWDELRTVYDPEIPVNVVDLGLVYGVDVAPLDEGGHAVKVTMTLTSPGCGMGDILKSDAETRVQAVAGVKSTEVDIVIEPPWNDGMMSEEARLELGLF